MKGIVFLLCSSLFCSIAFSQSRDDEKEIRNVFEKMHHSWIARDYAYLKYDLLDADAMLINPVGNYWRNKAEIANSLIFLGDIRFKYMTIVKDSILSIRFLAPSVGLVIVDVADRVDEDFSMPGSSAIEKKGDISEGIQSYTLVKRNDGWKITFITVTHVGKQ